MRTEEFEGISFRVRAVGDPTPNLTWLKDGRELPLPGRALRKSLKFDIIKEYSRFLPQITVCCQTLFTLSLRYQLNGKGDPPMLCLRARRGPSGQPEHRVRRPGRLHGDRAARRARPSRRLVPVHGLQQGGRRHHARPPRRPQAGAAPAAGRAPPAEHTQGEEGHRAGV